MRLFIPLLIAFLILVPLTYYTMLKIDNLFRGYTGSMHEKQSREYLKRKAKLKILSVPVALFILFLIGSILAGLV